MGWCKNGQFKYLYVYDTERKKLPEQHFENWGYEIELGCSNKYKIRNISCCRYFATPTADQSSKENSNPELCYPANLYKIIWL